MLSLNPQPLLKLHLRRNTMSPILVKKTFLELHMNCHTDSYVQSKSTCGNIGIFDNKRQFSSTAKTENSRIKKTSKSLTFFCLVWFIRGQQILFISKVSFQLRFLNFKVKVYLHIEIPRQTGLIENWPNKYMHLTTLANTSIQIKFYSTKLTNKNHFRHV